MKAFNHYDIVFDIAGCTESRAGPWDSILISTIELLRICDYFIIGTCWNLETLDVLVETFHHFMEPFD